jgi:hypothetical protein
MKQRIEVLKDSFVDYAGKTHHFIMVAISEPLIYEDGEVSVLFVSENTAIPMQTVTKGVKLGVAICNPEDKYNEEKGILKATARANNSDFVLFAHDKGQINTTVVRGFLKQEAEYLKNNPEKYIKGYADSRDTYNKNLEMKEIEKNMGGLEKAVVEELKNNPTFLDNAMKYLTWIRNRKGNKCKKQ